MENKKQLIYKEDLIAEYDRVHIGEAGKARKLMEDMYGKYFEELSGLSKG